MCKQYHDWILFLDGTGDSLIEGTVAPVCGFLECLREPSATHSKNLEYTFSRWKPSFSSTQFYRLNHLARRFTSWYQQECNTTDERGFIA